MISNNFSNLRYPLKCNIFLLILQICLFTQCIVVTEEEYIFFRKANEIDTIPPFGPLIVAFSEGIIDTTFPQFQFSPSFYSFTLYWNKTYDTFFVRFTEPLDGEKRYVMRISQPIYSKSGAVMYPKTDSLVFITLPLEKEPNNEFTDVDTLQQEICGSLRNIGDKDFYMIPSSLEKIVLIPVDCIIKTSIYNFEKKVIFIKDEIVVNDTIILNREDALPYYLIIEPSLKTASGYYIIKKI